MLDVLGRNFDLPKAICLTLSEEWMRNGVVGHLEEMEEGREWELGLVCKMKKDCFLF